MRDKDIMLPITVAKRISGDYDLQAGPDAASVIATVWGDDEDESCWPAKANAEFVANAINNHDELIHALERIVSYLESKLQDDATKVFLIGVKSQLRIAKGDQ